MILVTEMHYFPLINLYVDMLRVGNVFLNQDVVFKKSTFRNRMIIAGSTGIMQLSIPIVGGRNCRLPFDQVAIDYKSDWQSLHFKSLCTAYGKTPWFSHYKTELNDLYNTHLSSLASWNLLCMEWVGKKLKLENKLNFQTIKPSDGMEVLDRMDFYKPSNFNTIEMSPFVKYQQAFQTKNGFHSNLSILDLLLNEGPNAKNLISGPQKTNSR